MLSWTLSMLWYEFRVLVSTSLGIVWLYYLGLFDGLARLIIETELSIATNLEVKIVSVTFDVVEGRVILNGLRILSPPIEDDPRWHNDYIVTIASTVVTFDFLNALYCFLFTFGELFLLETVHLRGMNIFVEGYEDSITGETLLNVNMIGAVGKKYEFPSFSELYPMAVQQELSTSIEGIVSDFWGYVSSFAMGSAATTNETRQRAAELNVANTMSVEDASQECSISEQQPSAPAGSQREAAVRIMGESKCRAADSPRPEESSGRSDSRRQTSSRTVSVPSVRERSSKNIARTSSQRTIPGRQLPTENLVSVPASAGPVDDSVRPSSSASNWHDVSSSAAVVGGELQSLQPNVAVDDSSANSALFIFGDWSHVWSDTCSTVAHFVDSTTATLQQGLSGWSLGMAQIEKEVAEKGIIGAAQSTIDQALKSFETSMEGMMESEVLRMHERMSGPEPEEVPYDVRILGRHVVFDDIRVYMQQTMPVAFRHLEKKPLVVPHIKLSIKFPVYLDKMRAKSLAEKLRAAQLHLTESMNNSTMATTGGGVCAPSGVPAPTISLINPELASRLNSVKVRQQRRRRSDDSVDLSNNNPSGDAASPYVQRSSMLFPSVQSDLASAGSPGSQTWLAVGSARGSARGSADNLPQHLAEALVSPRKHKNVRMEAPATGYLHENLAESPTAPTTLMDTHGDVDATYTPYQEVDGTIMMVPQVTRRLRGDTWGTVSSDDIDGDDDNIFTDISPRRQGHEHNRSYDANRGATRRSSRLHSPRQCRSPLMSATVSRDHFEENISSSAPSAGLRQRRKSSIADADSIDYGAKSPLMMAMLKPSAADQLELKQQDSGKRRRDDCGANSGNRSSSPITIASTSHSLTQSPLLPHTHSHCCHKEESKGVASRHSSLSGRPPTSPSSSPSSSSPSPLPRRYQPYSQSQPQQQPRSYSRSPRHSLAPSCKNSTTANADTVAAGGNSATTEGGGTEGEHERPTHRRSSSAALLLSLRDHLESEKEREAILMAKLRQSRDEIERALMDCGHADADELDDMLEELVSVSSIDSFTLNGEGGIDLQQQEERDGLSLDGRRGRRSREDGIEHVCIAAEIPGPNERYEYATMSTADIAHENTSPSCHQGQWHEKEENNQEKGHLSVSDEGTPRMRRRRRRRRRKLLYSVSQGLDIWKSGVGSIILLYRFEKALLVEIFRDNSVRLILDALGGWGSSSSAVPSPRRDDAYYYAHNSHTSSTISGNNRRHRRPSVCSCSSEGSEGGYCHSRSLSCNDLTLEEEHAHAHGYMHLHPVHHALAREHGGDDDDWVLEEEDDDGDDDDEDMEGGGKGLRNNDASYINSVCSEPIFRDVFSSPNSAQDTRAASDDRDRLGRDGSFAAGVDSSQTGYHHPFHRPHRAQLHTSDYDAENDAQEMGASVSTSLSAIFAHADSPTSHNSRHWDPSGYQNTPGAKAEADVNDNETSPSHSPDRGTSIGIVHYVPEHGFTAATAMAGNADTYPLARRRSWRGSLQSHSGSHSHSSGRPPTYHSPARRRPAGGRPGAGVGAGAGLPLSDVWAAVVDESTASPIVPVGRKRLIQEGGVETPSLAAAAASAASAAASTANTLRYSDSEPSPLQPHITAADLKNTTENPRNPMSPVWSAVVDEAVAAGTGTGRGEREYGRKMALPPRPRRASDGAELPVHYREIGREGPTWTSVAGSDFQGERKMQRAPSGKPMASPTTTQLPHRAAGEGVASPQCELSPTRQVDTTRRNKYVPRSPLSSSSKSPEPAHTVPLPQIRSKSLMLSSSGPQASPNSAGSTPTRGAAAKNSAAGTSATNSPPASEAHSRSTTSHTHRASPDNVTGYSRHRPRLHTSPPTSDVAAIQALSAKPKVKTSILHPLFFDGTDSDDD